MKKNSRTHRTRSERAKPRLGMYKSQLEKYCAEKLAHAGIPFGYETKEFVLQDKFTYNGVYHKMTKGSHALLDKSNSVVLPIKYTPDFMGISHNFIIETKGFVHDQHTFLLRWKMFLEYLVNNEKDPPALFLPKNKQQVDQAVDIILQMIRDGRIQTFGDVRAGDKKNDGSDGSDVRRPPRRGRRPAGDNRGSGAGDS